MGLPIITLRVERGPAAMDSNERQPIKVKVLLLGANSARNAWRRQTTAAFKSYGLRFRCELHRNHGTRTQKQEYSDSNSDSHGPIPPFMELPIITSASLERAFFFGRNFFTASFQSPFQTFSVCCLDAFAPLRPLAISQRTTVRNRTPPQGCVVKIPRLRSGFRLAARTPPERLKMAYLAIEA